MTKDSSGPMREEEERLPWSAAQDAYDGTTFVLDAQGDAIALVLVGGMKVANIFASAPSTATAAREMMRALEEVLRVRDWVVRAGGEDGPLPQDTIRQFAEMQIAAVDAARSALESARSAGIGKE